MLKRHRKHVCGRICAKSIRLVLESYAEYLTSQGFLSDGIVAMCVPWNTSGGGLGGGRFASLSFRSSSTKACLTVSVRESATIGG